MLFNRREFVVSTAALIAAAALLGSAPLAVAQGPSPEELMRPGPLPDIVLGKADAPVTIVEYASMTCPHCATFSKTTFPALKSKYIDTGKVRFIFREFPLDELAAAASMLARCIDPQNGEKAMAVIDVLFHSQDKWAVRNPVPQLQQIAKQAGMHREGLRGVPGEPKALQRHPCDARTRQQGIQGGVDADPVRERQDRRRAAPRSRSSTS